MAASIDLFLAHAAEDTATAEELADQLGADVRVWLDVRSLLPGDQWPVAIPQAQSAALGTVILVSRSADAAYYVRDEIYMAIAQHRAAPERHRVVAVFLDGRPTDPRQILYGLGVLHSLDARAEGGLDGVARKLRELVTVLRDRGASPGSAPLSPPVVENVTRVPRRADNEPSVRPSGVDPAGGDRVGAGELRDDVPSPSLRGPCQRRGQRRLDVPFQLANRR